MHLDVVCIVYEWNITIVDIVYIFELKKSFLRSLVDCMNGSLFQICVYNMGLLYFDKLKHCFRVIYIVSP